MFKQHITPLHMETFLEGCVAVNVTAALFNGFGKWISVTFFSRVYFCLKLHLKQTKYTISFSSFLKSIITFIKNLY